MFFTVSKGIYQEILENFSLLFIDKLDGDVGFVFYQGLASGYTVIGTNIFSIGHGVIVSDYPGNPPELNLIKKCGQLSRVENTKSNRALLKDSYHSIIGFHYPCAVQQADRLHTKAH